MSEEELEKTGILKEIISKEDEEEMTINEMIEEFLEQLDYLEIDEKKKQKLKSLAKQIQEEKDEKAKEFLFNELKKIAVQCQIVLVKPKLMINELRKRTRN